MLVLSLLWLMLEVEILSFLVRFLRRGIGMVVRFLVVLWVLILKGILLLIGMLLLVIRFMIFWSFFLLL